MLKSLGAACVLRPSAVCALGLLAVALGALAVPTPATAWTDASVRSVKATVTVATDGAARVSMRVAVRVHGGWLEGLELVGLDPALVLDPSAPVIVTGEDGAVYVPVVAMRAEGTESTRVQLSFARSGAPRRGAYEVALVYTTSLAHRATEASADGDTLRVRWTLPPWQTGLDGVELTLDLPGAAQPMSEVGDEGDARAAQVSVVSVGARTQITWRRPHLPRTTVWTIAAEVPAASLAPALRRVSVAATPVVARRPPAPPAWPVPLALALALLSIGALTARARAAALRRAGLRAAPLVRLPRALRVVVCLALVAAAPLVAGAHPALAVLPLVLLLPLLLLGRGIAIDSGDGVPAEERPAGRADLRDAERAVLRARFLTPDALLDATTAPGALVALALLATAFGAHSLIASNASAPLFALVAALACVPLFAQTHRSRRPAPPEALRELRRIAARLRMADDAPAAVALSVSTRGSALVSARLRIAPATAPGGLRSLDIVLAERACGSAVATEPVLRIKTRNGTDADRALATTLDPWSASRGVKYTICVVPLSALDDVLRALACAVVVEEVESSPERDGEQGTRRSASVRSARDAAETYLGIADSSLRSVRSAD